MIVRPRPKTATEAGPGAPMADPSASLAAIIPTMFASIAALPMVMQQTQQTLQPIASSSRRCTRSPSPVDEHKPVKFPALSDWLKKITEEDEDEMDWERFAKPLKNAGYRRLNQLADGKATGEKLAKAVKGLTMGDGDLLITMAESECARLTRRKSKRGC